MQLTPLVILLVAGACKAASCNAAVVSALGTCNLPNGDYFKNLSVCTFAEPTCTSGVPRDETLLTPTGNNGCKSNADCRHTWRCC
ncbi:hypothetical protein Ptr902_13147 [Pyrenophora tritici-repentis]|uniref:Uncharacterized protein n=1 Tax=Pyrenophora tritici-repentis TaxID=45151 RepID=A0A5M9KPF2_9PLEO|nr:hypothetical protein PtrV1_13407 [Pyrenophora tritici-repentis]KAF7447570.1 hypothetical protein A1F99_090170 [Pyrenophora tritici-repentis]KAF7569951.1 hypothetical protein PtrM4_123660 [Pyrenophora tritici-repentis]KAI0568994.1 hypothetical protein Alg130_11836 [Pyrenophora tritici-repentis]KAI0573974.1 hypothetical protein Alg215_08862 [Pyrenophora tritici-repentis]